jgi:TonB family protein
MRSDPKHLLMAALLAWSSAVHADPAVVYPKIDIASCKKPEYSQNSLRREQEGVTVSGVLVRADGTAARSSLVLSSGHSELDAKLNASLSACRYFPGTVDGKPAEMWTYIDWRWVLEDADGSSALTRKLALEAKSSLAALYKLSQVMVLNAKTDAERRKAGVLLRSAAEQGQSMAQFKMGLIYEYGSGVPVDLEEARRWYEKAAAQENVFAVDRLRLGGFGQ